MRLIIVEEMSLEEYNKKKKVIKIPKQLFDPYYDKNLNKAVWRFWDSDFIPKEFKKYIDEVT
jgi:mannosyltransferase OCH1-like enzyme